MNDKLTIEDLNELIKTEKMENKMEIECIEVEIGVFEICKKLNFDWIMVKKS